MSILRVLTPRNRVILIVNGAKKSCKKSENASREPQNRVISRRNEVGAFSARIQRTPKRLDFSVLFAKTLKSRRFGLR